MKNCRKIHLLLALYRDQGLTPGQEKQVEAHLKICPQARWELEAFDRLRETLASLPEPQPPRDLHERIMARLHTGSPAQPAPLFRWKFPALGLAVAACLTLFFLVQHPDIMNPREKKAYKPSGQGFEVTAPSNQPLAALRQSPQNKVLPSRRAFTQTESADTYAKEMPAAAGSPASANNNYLAMAKSDLLRKKAFKSYSPETDLSQISPSSGNYAASTPPTMAQSSSNLDYSAGSDYKSSELEKKREEVSAATAAGSGMGGQMKKQEEAPASIAAAVPMPAAPQPAVAVPMAAAPPPAAPEASAVAALPPASSESNGASAFSVSTAPSYPSWHGIQYKTSFKGQQVLTDEQTFKTYWEGLNPGKEFPKVDLSSQAVVFICDTNNTHSPDSQFLISNEEDKPDQLIIHYRIVVNSDFEIGTIIGSIESWTMQIISKPTKPVLFQRDP